MNEQTVITSVATALYEGDSVVDFATGVLGLISIVVPPLNRFLDAVSNERDWLAMKDGMDEMPIVRGNYE